MTNQIEVPEKISQIAKIIRTDWKNINYGAKPYLEAMESINNIEDNYFEDSAASVVSYFLSNARNWRGNTAKAVKAKLNALLKSIGNASKQ